MFGPLIEDMISAYEGRYNTMLEFYVVGGNLLVVGVDLDYEPLFSYQKPSIEAISDDLWLALFENKGRLHRYGKYSDGGN